MNPIVVQPVDVSAQRISRVAGVREGERFVKHALSALAFDDVSTAVSKLQSALAILAPFSSKERK
jgi:hypothetical protein